MKTRYVAGYFTQALFELLKEKSYEDISITDLVNKSGCSKASFYRNFLNKDQILDNYLMDNIHPIINRNFIEEKFKQELINMFTELLQHKQQLSLLYKANQINRLDKVFLNSSILQINIHNSSTSKYTPYYYAGATSSFVKAWISFDFSESAEEMADIFFKTINMLDNYNIP